MPAAARGLEVTAAVERAQRAAGAARRVAELEADADGSGAGRPMRLHAARKMSAPAFRRRRRRRRRAAREQDELREDSLRARRPLQALSVLIGSAADSRPWLSRSLCSRCAPPLPPLRRLVASRLPLRLSRLSRSLREAATAAGSGRGRQCARARRTASSSPARGRRTAPTARGAPSPPRPNDVAVRRRRDAHGHARVVQRAHGAPARRTARAAGGPRSSASLKRPEDVLGASRQRAAAMRVRADSSARFRRRARILSSGANVAPVVDEDPAARRPWASCARACARLDVQGGGARAATDSPAPCRAAGLRHGEDRQCLQIRGGAGRRARAERRQQRACRSYSVGGLGRTSSDDLAR